MRQVASAYRDPDPILRFLTADVSRIDGRATYHVSVGGSFTRARRGAIAWRACQAPNP